MLVEQDVAGACACIQERRGYPLPLGHKRAHTFIPNGPCSFTRRVQSDCKRDLDLTCLCGLSEAPELRSNDGISPEDILCYHRPRDDDEGFPVIENYVPTEIERYCIQRLMVLNGCYLERNYHEPVKGRNGNSVVFEHQDQLLYQINRMLNLPTDVEKLLYTLHREYGFIDAQVAGAKSVRVVTRKLHEVIPKLQLATLKRHTSYPYKLKPDDIMGVLFNGTELVDGRQRVAYGSHSACIVSEFQFLELV
ncbi:hypothetical protein ACYPKM_01790 [Pseudomonas aeruginosa]